MADQHYNTLVTARAGSGKTRVIVAKVAYLVATGFADLDQIAVFMFNRTAAAEVNQRIAAVRVDGRNLVESVPTVASTFHKFALEIVRQSGQRPQIISEIEQEKLIRRALDSALTQTPGRLSPKVYQETLEIVQNFVTRAGQSFPDPASLTRLQQLVNKYCQAHQHQPEYQARIHYHQLASQSYQAYLAALQPPRTDFNQLMSRATQLILTATAGTPIYQRLNRLKYLMIDEYQDFSYLFFAIIQAVRQVAPHARLFAVGDDWQAINRFAGSNVDYFLNFASYFPVDCVNIPLATNYRSCRRIVDYANQYMLRNYDPQALPARAFNRSSGQIRHLNPARVRFNFSDIAEDGLGDARYLRALQTALAPSLRETQSASVLEHQLTESARLLKCLTKLIQKSPHADYLILHRHNFTSHAGVTLEMLASALRQLLDQEHIMTVADFDHQIRLLTMHRSKGLEAENVILLEVEAEIVQHLHPHATLFELLGDNVAAERADQQRLLYVALTRAKKHLYILSRDRKPPV